MVTGIQRSSFFRHFRRSNAAQQAALPFGTTRWQWACLLVLMLSVVVYLPSLGGTFFWDDVPLVNGNAIGGGDTLAHCFTRPFLQYYYRPMVSVTFFLENRVADFSPSHYHQTNILLHLLAVAWLIRLLHFAFQSKLAAWLGGLLFALQPAQVGGVAWIGGRTDALCGLFMISFADNLLRGAWAEGRRRAGYLTLSTLAYALALLTKEQMLGAIPLVPLAFRWFPPQEGAPVTCRTMAKATLPFLGAALALVVLMARFGPPLTQAPLGHTDPVLSGSRSILYYVLLLLLPAPRWMHTLSVSAFAPLGGWAILLAAGIALCAAALLVRWTRKAPAAAWFLAWSLCLFLPVSNLLPLPSLLVAPYRIATAGIGVAALLGWLLANAIANAPHHSQRLTFAAFAALLVCWYGALTFQGAGVWRDTRTFFGAVKHYDSGCLSARYNLAGAEIQEHRTREALAEIEPLLDTLFGASGWQNASDVLYAAAHNPDLMAQVEDTQGGRTPLRERLARLYVLLGAARLLDNNLSGARDAYRIGLALDPKSPRILAGLARCARQAGNLLEAIRCLRCALPMESETSGESVTTRAALAQAWMAAGQWRQAESEWRECVRSSPDSGGVYYIPLAQTQWQLGEKAAAHSTLQAACQTSVRPIALRAIADLQR